eukprot:gnl/MRDRNA2_/MRDRNA2_108697_c0_seq1.p1 gnl/MRDRNA2_/MRDRNA2_108697_c0~~gnl/MRDRNA2_/MRDRNA2_108697_c0_seq1.p1  ORF type:complete len:1012 (+),score=188.37 gnl/MRDRNA2_/MRDRNA2_108697_c0_seq1:97-3132(+)
MGQQASSVVSSFKGNKPAENQVRITPKRKYTPGTLPEEAAAWFTNRNEHTLAGALAFVPWVIMQSHAEGMLDDLSGNDPVVHRGEGAVVFSDASGFTALTERLAKKINGAELLCQCLTNFFTPLIDLILAYRGDVIKFSGDALTIYHQAVEDTAKNPYVPPCGTFGCEGHDPVQLSVIRASACCIEIHKRLHMFDTGVDGVKLCLHIGVGCGPVTILQVGGVIPPETHVPRFEYVVAGPPLEQISIAEPLASNGETVLSPQAWEHVKHTVIEGEVVADRPDFHRLLRMEEKQHTFPTLKSAAKESDKREKYRLGLAHADVLRRYIPSAVFKQIEGGTLTYVNEMRNISVIFIQCAGVDVSTDNGSKVAQKLMTGVQKCCYSHEGTLNKFLVDDKGLLFLLVFGLPPMVHMDDPLRATLACMDMVQLFKSMNLGGRFGVTTGRNYCGVCGSNKRMEYTTLGDTVNLSARLMANAPPLGLLVCEDTHKLAQKEIDFEALNPIKVKGKTALIPIFKPTNKKETEDIGIGPSNKINFPWSPVSSFLGGKSRMTEMKNWLELLFIQRLLGKTQQAVRRLSSAIDADELTVNQGLFEEGGVLVLSGENGMGKMELAEYVLSETVKQNMIPTFSTMGCRPGEKMRPVTELLKSVLAGQRKYDHTVPVDNLEALNRLAPVELKRIVPMLGTDLRGQQILDSEDESAFTSALELALHCLKKLLEHQPVICCMALDMGTNLYEKTMADSGTFWEVAAKLSALAKPDTSNGRNAFVLVIMCNEGPKDHVGLQYAKQKNWLLRTSPLCEDGVVEYMSFCLNVREQQIPKPLHQYVAKLSQGNALYIRETIDQLVCDKHIEVFRDSSGNAEGLYHNKDLESIQIANWSHTAMIGGTICLLESLDPLESAVVKMSTVFDGVFTVADLAASSCSRWAGATLLDNLRLYKAVNFLVKRNIIDIVAKGSEAVSEAMQGHEQYFILSKVLIRKVGGAMVLEAQKKAVKRQALIERVLAKDLPAHADDGR